MGIIKLTNAIISTNAAQQYHHTYLINIKSIITINNNIYRVINDLINLMIKANVLLELIRVVQVPLTPPKSLVENAEIAFDLQKVADTDRGGNEITIKFRSTKTSEICIIR